MGGAKAEAGPSSSPAEDRLVQAESPGEFASVESSNWRSRIWRIAALAAVMVALAATLGWWRWQQAWAELEAPVLANEAVKATPQLTVAPDIMQQRLMHKVIPDYPESARQAGVQGKVVLDAVIDANGAVTDVAVVSGPEALARAAADAVRWWRYEPYEVNGQALPVETSVMVEFRLAN